MHSSILLQRYVRVVVSLFASAVAGITTSPRILSFSLFVQIIEHVTYDDYAYVRE